MTPRHHCEAYSSAGEEEEEEKFIGSYIKLGGRQIERIS
jgi:hypothetical protein